MVRCIVAKRAILNVMAGVFSASVLMSAPQVLAAGTSTQTLEAQIRLLEEQLQSIRGELDRVKTDTVRNEQKIQQNEQSVASAREQSNAVEKGKHMLFFRGGFAHSNHSRNGVSIQSNVVPVTVQDRADKGAWYVGAGLDFNLTDNVWGYMPGTSIFGELMFEYKEFSGKVKGNEFASNPTVLVNPAGGTPRNVTVGQFTLSAAPKIKFLEGSRFRPWIIPAGLAIHVISPPSESITVMKPGVMFGVGADYNIWKSIYLGVDARYHIAGGKIDGVNIDGYNVGGYLGIGF